MTVAAIKPAATVLLLRDGPDGLEVFMVRRSQHMGFAGGSHVFPGGRVEATDVGLVANPILCRHVPDVGRDAMAFRVAAIRETFEESGILLARDRHGEDLIGGPRAHALNPDRLAVDGGALPFAELLAREALTLAADLLVPYAHWVTPPVFPKRYDTMFFLAVAPDCHPARHDGGEAVESCWITPAQALAPASGLRLEFVTRRNLERLGRSVTVAEALAAARRAPIVTVHPLVEDTERGRVARLPVEAGYGGPLFDFSR